MIRQVFNSSAERAEALEKNPMVITVEEPSPEESAQMHAQRERYERNRAWLTEHAKEVYAQHRGRHICVAGGELFVAGGTLEAVALAKAAHPEDNGQLVMFISPIPGPRIYANQRRMASLS